MSRADDMAALEALVATHRPLLQGVIDLAEQPRTDRVAQRILNGLATDARAYLRRLEAAFLRPTFHPTHGDLGLWGENGLAPTIRALAQSAEFQASFVPMEMRDLGCGKHRVAA